MQDIKNPLLALALHAVLFAFLLIQFKGSSSFKLPDTSSVIQAVAVSQNQLRSLTSSASVQHESPSKEVSPVKQQAFKQEDNAQEAQHPQKIVVHKKTKKVDVQKKLQEKRLTSQQIKQDLSKALQQDAKKQAVIDKKKELALAKKATQQLLKESLTQSTATESSSENSAEVDKYKALIINAISQKWIVPLSVEKNLEAKLLIRVAPGGMVLDVKIVKSSGNAALDLSAQTAVYKASPLPMPQQASLQNEFRIIHLTVRPEGML